MQCWTEQFFLILIRMKPEASSPNLPSAGKLVRVCRQPRHHEHRVAKLDMILDAPHQYFLKTHTNLKI